MKLSRLFMIALLVGTMGAIGCGDSGGGANAGEACSGPRCANNDALRVACESEFNDCVDRGVNVEECVLGAEAACGGI
jgi:hypothetical protein